MSFDELKKKESIFVELLECEIKVEDINDVKSILWNQNSQAEHFTKRSIVLEFDNGTNTNNYNDLRNERLTVSKEYKEQLNMNIVDCPEEIQQSINKLKVQIGKYEQNINEMTNELNKISENNIVGNPEDIFQQKMRASPEQSKDTLPLFLVIVYCVFGLFLGRFMSSLI